MQKQAIAITLRKQYITHDLSMPKSSEMAVTIGQLLSTGEFAAAAALVLRKLEGFMYGLE